MENLTPTLAQFVSACDAMFGFLVRDYGFHRMATPMDYHRYSVCYRKGDLEVDVYGEGYGTLTACALLRGDDRLDLGILLPAEARHPLPMGQLSQVAAIASQLQQYAADFLRGDLTRFDTALLGWQKRYPKRPR